ncbi:porin [Vibrio penaeicida]|uniref:porin n=1 Tax=Vibrio penaeicida TaxID=104609 RepID=UPI000CEA1916|nr:porin [Vibrio penaeicida]
MYSILSIRHTLLSSCLLASCFSVSAEISLVDEETYQAELYGKAKILARYQSTSSQFKLTDDRSRIGVKGHWDLEQARLYSTFEVGTHLNTNADDLLSVRLFYAGLRTDSGRVDFGKQEALIHNLDNYDFTNKLGGAAHITRESLGNKRNENTLSVRTDVEDWRLMAQYNFSRNVDQSVRLGVGSQSLKTKEKRINNGWSTAAQYRNRDLDLQVRGALQVTTFENNARSTSVGITVVKKNDLYGAPVWYAGTLGHYELDDNNEIGQVFAAGASVKFQVHQGFNTYSTIENLTGSDVLSGGKETSAALGLEFVGFENTKLYTEAQRSWFDEQKTERWQVALGAHYQF